LLKTATMLALSANISILFTELPFLERFQAAADSGFSAVEMWFPYDWPIEQVATRARDAGLPCVCINAPPGDVAKGDFGYAAVASRKQEFLAGLTQALEYADALGAGTLHVLAGMRVEDRAGMSNEPAENPTYMAHLREAAELCARSQKTLLIEPLNPVDRPGYLLSRQQQARAVVQRLGMPNVKIMYDLYHAEMTGEHLLENLRLNWDMLGHVQIADAPGRHEPGTGLIDFEAVFAELKARGYAGFVGCEYKPIKGIEAGATVAGLGWRSRFLNEK
jgi:2-dehydrotetronate isomerase